MSNILITANSISKVYDNDFLLKRGANFYALKAVDFELQEGDFVSIMGPSGSGKSTLLNCLSTLDVVSSGSIKVLDHYVGEMPDKLLSEYRSKYLGFVFQNHNLVPALSVFDNIATPLILNEIGVNEIKERVNEIAVKLNIDKLLYKKPNECSGGERQRVAIARAIITKPKILFCDEPTGNLDSKNSHEVLTLLKTLNDSGTSIVLVTHDNMIASYAKQFMYLRDGQIIMMAKRGNSSQVDFFNKIVKVTTEDSLLKLFNTDVKDNETMNEEIEVIVNKENPKKNIRSIVYAIVEGKDYDKQLVNKNKVLQFNNDKIIFTGSFNSENSLDYNQIKEANISMCSRFIMSPPMPENRYYIDLDLVLEDSVYKFEICNQKNSEIVFEVLKQHNIIINDPYDIMKIFKERPDYLVRHKYLLYHFKEIANKYGLDNPR